MLQEAWLCGRDGRQVALGQPFHTDFETDQTDLTGICERGWIVDRVVNQ